MGYANDVMSYIPSVIIHEEGGYEAMMRITYMVCLQNGTNRLNR